MYKTAFLSFLFSSFFMGCKSPQTHSPVVSGFPTETTALLPAANVDRKASATLLHRTADTILGALKQRNTALLSRWIHPEWKLHFSPYGYIDKPDGQTLDSSALQTLLKKGTVVYWVPYDGSGDPIDLTLKDYLDGFVLDRDFVQAPAIAVDSIMGHGNTLLNMKEAYPEARFVEYYFPGTEAMGYMDWKTLRLLFQQRDGKLWLVCIAHDEWTI